ncbi:SulP family inorganic anion transporter [Streptomyces sp. NPDC048172]|uniref:SulP family inorganic anion transporter n=1 Tax=Streptomyces sp. NPDC048172 TaxID=3365505 RepID=UPI0037157978
MPTRGKTTARHARRAPVAPGGGVVVNDSVASLVVFLVALPLCIGVAAASGVPVSLGIISGIIGGLVVGLLPGSSLQVSGPAAGLAALVLEFVTTHGVGMLGPVVLAAGLVQIALGLLRMGRVFQSISVSVVQGMLAGIGLPLILSQSYALMDAEQHGSALENLSGLPALLGDTFADPGMARALALGVLSLAVCFLWKKVPGPPGKVPAPLVAVVLGAAVAALPGFDVRRVVVGDLLGAVDMPGPSEFSGLADPAVLGMVVTFAVIASAESLFSAAAVDRMHTGPRTEYNKELFAQGVGNSLCGLAGALPMTAVIARSSANVQAGAKTKISRVLHGGWLLGFGLLLPGLLGLIPVTVLAGILVHAGWKLFDPAAFPKMWRTDRGEGVVMIVTTLAIIVANLLEGVLAGLAVAIVLSALRMSRVTVRTETETETETETGDGAATRLVLGGNMTFLRLPRLSEALESVADHARVCVDLTGVHHLDLACRSRVEEWAEQRRKAGAEETRVLLPGEETDPVPERGPDPEFDPVRDTAEFEAVPQYANAYAPAYHGSPPYTPPPPVAGAAAHWTPEDERAAYAYGEGTYR